MNSDQHSSGDDQDDPLNRTEFRLTNSAAMLHDALTPNQIAKKRTPRCPSRACKVALSKHEFGQPHKDCQGPPTSSPTTSTTQRAPASNFKKTTFESASQLLPSSSQHSSPGHTHGIEALHRQLRSLEAEHDALETTLLEEQRLLQQIAEKKAALATLRSKFQNFSTTIPSQSTSSNAPTIADSNYNLHGVFDTSNRCPTIPPYLQQHPSSQMPAHLATTTPRSLASVYNEQQARHKEVFLRPSRSSSNSQGKALRIPDFVSRLTPQDDEKIISSDDSARLTLTLGSKKPKLESITMADFSIANIRIFYELLTSNRLPTPDDLRDYLSYSVKIFELGKKFTWSSVLKYDDEFRMLQHTYGYPWDKDHSHLHEIMLVPRWAAGGNQGNQHLSSGSGSGSHPVLTFPQDAGGTEICRNFNRNRGCTKTDCRFSHVCNRKVGNKACGKPHAGCNHSRPQDP